MAHKVKATVVLTDNEAAEGESLERCCEAVKQVLSDELSNYSFDVHSIEVVGTE